MAKTTKVNEIPGITSAAIVQLTRMGVVTLQDLLNADFDRMAYVIEDYKEATRLVSEAQRLIKARGPAGAKSATKHAEPHAKPVDGHPADHIVPARPHTPEAPDTHRRADGHSEPSNGEANVVAAALAVAAHGAPLSDPSNPEPRMMLARRLAVADLLLRYRGTEHEVAAALLTEPVEGGELSPQGALASFGPEIWRVLEQVMALRAVPLLPSGKPPKYWMDMARNSPPAARRVCAAFLTQSLATTSAGGVDSNLFHARLLLEALRQGGDDDLVELAAASLEHAGAEQASRLAA